MLVLVGRAAPGISSTLWSSFVAAGISAGLRTLLRLVKSVGGPAGKAVFGLHAVRELRHAAVNALDQAATAHFEKLIFEKLEATAPAR